MKQSRFLGAMLAFAVVFAMAVLLRAVPMSLVEARADMGDAVAEFSSPLALEEGGLASGQGYWWFASPGEGIRQLDGDPASGYSNEPEPDGSQINMGAYGNTLEAATGLEALLDEIKAEVSRLRELSFLEEVDCQFITRDELREWLIEDLEGDIEEINITQELFVLLDLIEEGQDLYNVLLELYSEQIIGFYDSGLEGLYVVSDVAELGPLEEVTFAHEYTHALQDQHFDLESLPRPEDDSDLSIAGSSLVEGDANLLEAMYYWLSFDDAEREAYAQQIAELDNKAFESAPRVIQENLIFPYVSGLDFVYTLWEEDGWDAVNQAYGDPPQSTEQILHPEKYYLARDEPQAITMPDLENALGAGWSLLDSDVLGELTIRIYLESFLGIDSEEAINAAEGWDGDRYVFLEDIEDRKLLVLSSVWDSQTEAEEFFHAYITFVENKSGGTWTLYLDDVGKKWWKTEELSLYLRQQGSEVLLIIAPDEAITRQVLTVTYSPAALDVNISSPTGMETYSTSQHFDLTFTISNSGEADALDVTATIDPGVTAEVEGQGEGVSWTTPVLGDIPGSGTKGPFSYDIHCTGSGDNTITVTPGGTDENTGVAITDATADSVTVKQEAAAALEVEISSPVGTETYSISQHFDLTLTIKNNGEADALDVTATIDPSATAEAGGRGEGVSWTTPVLGDILGGGTIGPFSYDVHCTGSGDSTITATPAGIDGNTGEDIADVTADSVTVNKEKAAALRAEISYPSGAEKYSTSQHFDLTFTISNSGEADALNVTATIDPGAAAEVEGQGQRVSWTTSVLDDIPGGGTIGPFTYDMHCTSSGASTITVTPGGMDENTGVDITDITADNVTVRQETAAALEVEISSPTGTGTYSTCQQFELTFTIKNYGEADALDVTAIIDPGAAAEVKGQGQSVSWTTPVLGDILSGRRIGPLTYDMHCTASGDSTITVTPAGMDKNTGEDITDITPDSVTIEQVRRLTAGVIAGIAVGACAAAVGIFFALRRWGWKRQ